MRETSFCIFIMDIDKKMIKYFKNSNSRYCCIFKNFPMAYVLEHEIGMLMSHDDSDNENRSGKLKLSL